MQRFADNLIGDVWAVKIAGIDVIHTERQRFAQHGNRGMSIFWRTKYAWACQLHRPVAEAINELRTKGKRSVTGHNVLPVTS